MLKGRAFGQRTCFDQGAPNLRVSRRNAVFSRFNKPPLGAGWVAVDPTGGMYAQRHTRDSSSAIAAQRQIAFMDNSAVMARTATSFGCARELVVEASGGLHITDSPNHRSCTSADRAPQPITSGDAYNKITSTKELVIYPDFVHEPLSDLADRIFTFLCSYCNLRRFQTVPADATPRSTAFGYTS